MNRKRRSACEVDPIYVRFDAPRMCNKLVVAGASDSMIVEIGEGQTVARKRQPNSKGVDPLAIGTRERKDRDWVP